MNKKQRAARTERSGWAKSQTVVLVARDYELLAFLGEVGVARTHHLVQMFFPSRSTAADRLRKLYCAGFIRCFVRGLNEDNAYTLTDYGRDALTEAGRGSAHSVVRKLPRQLEHRSMIVDMRVLFACASANDPRVELGEFVMDRELARLGLPKPVPDAKIALVRRATGARLEFLIECDRATESANWLVREKLGLYAEAARLGVAVCGLKAPLVIVVVPSIRRARSIAERMREQVVTGSFAFAIASALTVTNVLGASYGQAEALLNEGVGAFRLSLIG